MRDNQIQNIAQGIVNQILKQGELQNSTIQNEIPILTSINNNTKSIDSVISDIKDITQLIKINLKRIKLQKFNTDRQHQAAINKFIKQQKKLLQYMSKKIIQINNLQSTIQQQLNDLSNVNNTQVQE